MAQQIINVGAAPNDGQGDPIRTAFIKTNNNFGELYSRVQATPPVTLVGSIGDVEGMTAYDQDFYYYCFQDYDGSSVIWRQVPNALNAEVTDLTATGNVVAAYFSGDGSNISNVAAAPSTKILNGTSNVDIPVAGQGIFFTVNSGNVGGIVESNITPGAYGLVINTFMRVTQRLTSAGNVFAGQDMVANGNVIGQNITANSTLYANALSLAGNVISDLPLTGNLTVGGTTSLVGNIQGPVNASGNITAGNLLTPGSVSAAGNVTGAFLFGDGGGISNVTVVSNVAVTQIANGTSVIAISGSGGNATITVGGTSNVMVITSTGANISGYVNATGNVDGGNLTTSGRILATGNITGGNLTTGGNVVSTSGVTGVTVTASGNLSGGNITTTGIGNIGTLAVTGQTSLVGNITSAVNVTSNITANNIAAVNAVTAGTTMSAVGNVAGGNLTTTGQVFAIGNVSGANIAAGQRVIATGNIVGANFSTAGALVATGNVTGGNIDTGGLVTAVGNVTGGNINTIGSVSATGNIESGGTLSVTGNITAGNVSTGAGTITVGNILCGGGNLLGNIGNTTTWFGNAYLKAVNALYADLSEKYLADAHYEAGTVLQFGGSAELTCCVTDSCAEVAGVVSTKPAYEMNSALHGEHVTSLALAGRVPCKVTGPVWPGAMMVSAGSGRARAEKNPSMGTVIGKALQASEGGETTIEVVVGRL